MDFYQALFGQCQDSILSITTLPDKKIRHYRSDELERFMEDIGRLGAITNTYINLNPRRPDIPSGVRGGNEDAEYATCIAADCDVFGPAHREADLPPSKEAVIELLSRLPHPPTFLVDSGYGIYAFWILKEPVRLDNDAIRDKVSGIWSGYGKFLIRMFREKGWKLDNVFDLARMLRAPGSKNFKLDEPVNCRVLSNSGIFYDLEDFAPWYEAPVQEEKTSYEADERIVGSANRIMDGCRFIRKLVDDPEGVTEPEWKAQADNIAPAIDGVEKFHEWSSLYSGYTFEETEYKLRRALEARKPCTCAYIRNKLGFDCPEGGCGVKAPVVFALLSRQEQLQNLLAKEPLSAEDVLEEYALRLAAYAREHSPADYSRLKLKVKKTGVSIRDFERAVRSEQEKREPLTFDVEPTEIRLDGIDLHGAMEPVGYRVSMENGVTTLHRENELTIPVTLCHEPVVITRRLENIDSGQEKLELSFFRNGRWKVLSAARSSVLNKSSLVRLADTGLSVSSDNAEGVVRYLSAYEAANADMIPFTRSIDRIGWIGREFYPCAVNSEIVYEGDDADRIVGAIRESGDYERWLETAAKLRKNPFGRAILAASFASPLLEPLQNRVILLHIWHSSRSDKTAALKLALSVWGDPLKLMGNFNSTAVGLERRAGTLKHLPLGLDELQVLNEKRLSPALIVYSLGNGYGKTRGAKNGGLQKVPTWRSCVISTGEQPLGGENAMDGVSSRVLELYGQPIPDTEFGRTVHQISESSYGFAGKRFIACLIDTILPDKSRLRTDYNAMREKLRADFDGDPGAHLDNVAVLALADRYSSECLFGASETEAAEEAVQLGLTVLQNAKSQEKEDVVERAWHFVEDWVASNRKRFCLEAIPCYGVIEGGGVYIIGNALRQALEEAGFSYTKSIRGFRDKGYIATFPDSDGKERSQCQKKVQGVNVRAFFAKIGVQQPVDPEEDFLADPVVPLTGLFTA